jgi:hypothetical protein
MTPQDDAVEEMMALDDEATAEAEAEAEAEAVADWNSSFNPFLTADGYDFATFMLHFNPLFDTPGIQIDPKAFLAPGASVTFTLQ